jgi:predicted nucleic acid-binding protein
LSDFADPFTVIFDTNVLANALKRNIVLSFAEAGFYRPCWSAHTVDAEFERALIAIGVAPKKARQQKENILKAFPEARVGSNPGLLESLNLPDKDDRHVLAAAIQRKAAVIVTENLKHFPAKCPAPYEIEAFGTDGFIADCIDLAEPDAVKALRTMRARFRKPALDGEELLRKIEANGLTETATLLAPHRLLF